MGSLAVYIRHNNFGAASREFFRACPSDSCARSGNHNDLTLNAHVRTTIKDHIIANGFTGSYDFFTNTCGCDL